MASAKVAVGFTDIVGITYSSARKVAVVAERSGKLTLLDLLREEDGLYESRVIGSGYVKPTHLAIDAASSRLIIADEDGLWQAKLSDADRADAIAFATQPGEVRALGVLGGVGQRAGWPCWTRCRHRTSSATRSAARRDSPSMTSFPGWPERSTRR